MLNTRGFMRRVALLTAGQQKMRIFGTLVTTDTGQDRNSGRWVILVALGTREVLLMSATGRSKGRAHLLMTSLTKGAIGCAGKGRRHRDMRAMAATAVVTGHLLSMPLVTL